jgi:methyl-accepting chemotaxis protein
VRELAQRTATAAKEIKVLITQSGDQVKSGVSLVDDTGAALTSIVEQVKQINSNVEAIVIGSREQATGLAEINTAVNTIDQALSKTPPWLKNQPQQATRLPRKPRRSSNC